MPKQITTIQKCAWGFAALFLGVYLLDYVPGIMDANGLMFGLFHMTRIVDIGHLAAGALGVIGALTSGARRADLFLYIGDVVFNRRSRLFHLPSESDLFEDEFSCQPAAHSHFHRGILDRSQSEPEYCGGMSAQCAKM